jgi:hypothetical protein
MIRYALACETGHRFEAWFSDSAAFERQRAQGHVGCPECGDLRVEKALMAPAVAPARRKDAPPSPKAPPAEAAPPVPSSPPPAPAQIADAVRALHKSLREKADYVGDRFAQEARRRHVEDGDARPVWGEATLGQARELLDDGVPIAPLPPLPRRDD